LLNIIGKFLFWITLSLECSGANVIFIRRLTATTEKYSASIRLHWQKFGAAATAAWASDSYDSSNTQIFCSRYGERFSKNTKIASRSNVKVKCYQI